MSRQNRNCRLFASVFLAASLLAIAGLEGTGNCLPFARAASGGPRQSTGKAMGTTRNYCYLRAVRSPFGKVSGGGTLIADYVEWGEDAEGIVTIRNQNPRLRTLPVTVNARVFLVTNPKGVIGKRLISFAAFAALWNNKKPAPVDVYFGASGHDFKKELYSVVVTRGGVVAELRHEYQP